MRSNAELHVLFIISSNHVTRESQSNGFTCLYIYECFIVPTGHTTCTLKIRGLHFQLCFKLRILASSHKREFDESTIVRKLHK